MNEDNVEPLVTIALPVFNGGNTLAEAIQSLLDQTYQNFELIIIDDGSTDNSLEVVNSYDINKIKLIKNIRNLGLSASVNKAVEIASGKYFARMDQDDICFPSRIEKQVRYLLVNSEIDLVATSILVFDEKYQSLGTLPVKIKHEDICKSPLQGFRMPHPTWLGKIEWFRANRYLSEADGAEDSNLLFRTYKFSKFACLPEPLLAYREPKRKLKKMFRMRSAFVKANAGFAWKNKNRMGAFVIILSQVAKVIGDFANIILGIKFVRNKLVEVDKSNWMHAIGAHKVARRK